MEYIYADLVRAGRRTLESIPAKKMVAVCKLLIYSGDITLDDVPEDYREEVREALEEDGYEV